MENIVKIYKVTVKKAPQMPRQAAVASLEPWVNDSPYYDGWDDGGQDYILPEGYHIGQDVMRAEHIYDAAGKYCDMDMLPNGVPVLTSASGVVYLKRAVAK